MPQARSSAARVLTEAPSYFRDDFNGGVLDGRYWDLPIFRISDQVNGELNACTPNNIAVTGGNLEITSRFEDCVIGDSIQAPAMMNYTSGHIQQKGLPWLYGTVSVRQKVGGGTGIAPCVWLLEYKWKTSQRYTANDPNHAWPTTGWGEIDLAEFMNNDRSQVNCTAHIGSSDGSQLQALPFDATSRFMVYRLRWSSTQLIWDVDPEDGGGFQTLRTVTGARVPQVPMYVTINQAVGGLQSGTPNSSTFPLTSQIDYVDIAR